MSSKLEILHSFESYESRSELESIDQELLESAAMALKNAYAPYSKFKVGAAIRLENGIIVNGTNQENAAYPSGLCAERVAVFYASSQYPSQRIVSIAITVVSDNKVIEKPVSPCGACRQSLLEYEVKFNYPIRLIMSGEKGKVIISPSVLNLLPLAFNNSDL